MSGRFETPGPETGFKATKIPTPKTLKGNSDDRNPAKIEAWIDEVKDYFILSETPKKNQATVLQYFLEDTAKEFYRTKRKEANAKGEELDVNQFLEDIQRYLISSTRIGDYWKQWNNIFQVKGDKTQRISDVAIEIQKVATQLGTDVGAGPKIQKFLDAMHPQLRRVVEPTIDKRTESEWPDIVKLAERQDAVLYQTGTYKKSDGTSKYRQPRTAALDRPNANNWRPNPKKNNRKTLSFQEKKDLQAQKKCYFCKKTGHMIKECRKRIEHERQNVRTACTRVGQEEPETFEEYLEMINTPREEPSSSAIGQRNNDMVTSLKINGVYAQTLFDTGTTGTNLIANIFVQSNGIETKELNPAVVIRLATRGSKTIAKQEVVCKVEIAKGIVIETRFLVVPIKDYQAIMGMPFLQKHEVKLDTANGTAIFGKYKNYTIQCNEARSAAIMATAATGAVEQPVKIPDFTAEFPAVFPAEEPERLPPLREGCNHKIRIITDQQHTFKKRYVPVANAWIPLMREFIKKWKRNGIAVIGEGLYACPTFAVKKPGRNEPRWVHDLRERNRITQRDYTPIPEQRRMLESAAQAKFLSVLDLADAYHQIRIEPEYEQYNTINTPFGCYTIRVMLQGDTNAPATMMRNMNAIFGDISGSYVWVYLDDIVVFSKTKEEHLHHLREIFKRLQKAEFYLKLHKCQFMQKRIKLLGHVIEDGKIMAADEHIQKILEWEQPKNKRQLQALIGLVNYVAPHLPHAATITAPLTELTGAKRQWSWDDMHTHAFNQLKQLCGEKAALRPLNYKDIQNGNSNVFLVTDASRLGTGALICHGKNYNQAKENIAALHSRKFTSAQENYMTTDQECLAIVDALKAFEIWLLGIPFTVITDHKALEYMMNADINSPRRMRWMEYMQRFDFRIQFQPGSTNILADALSRIYENEPEEGVKNETAEDLEEQAEKEYLYSIDFPTDEEIQNELDNEDRQQITNPHSSRTSIARSETTIPHVMARTKAIRSKKPRMCDKGLHWFLCRSREGCPWHGTIGTFQTRSRYMEESRYLKQFEDTDDETTSPIENEPGNPHRVVPDKIPRIPEQHLEGGERIQEGSSKSSSELSEIPTEVISAYQQFDDDGYPRNIKWITTTNTTEKAGTIQNPDSGSFRVVNGRRMNTEGTSHVITRSKGRQIEAKKKEEGSRKEALEASFPTEEEPTDVDEPVELAYDPEAHADNEMEIDPEDERAEWMRKYKKDLILPGGELPYDLISGVIRVVDGKEYKLDDYENQLMKRVVTPLETNIYHAGNTDPSFLPMPFRNLDYTTPYGRTILEALENDPIVTSVIRRGGDPYHNTPLGYIIVRKQDKAVRVYIPEGAFTPKDTGIASTIRKTMIDEAHHELGHLGIDKTYLRISTSCYWPGMFKDVERYVKTCPQCQINKHPTSKPAGVAHVLPIPEHPWESIAIDFCGPLTKSQGFENIMVIMDRFSGFLLLFPLPGHYSAMDVADVFIHTFYARYGFPQSIVSDRDPRFTGKFWQSLQETLGIELLMATSFHQETNGQVERTNKEIMQMLRIYTPSAAHNWSFNLWRVEHAHNTAQSTWINKSPFEMVYGKKPIDIPTELPETRHPAVEKYLDNLVTEQRKAHDALILARFRQAETVSKRRNPNITFRTGDYVLYKRRTRTSKTSKKLHSVWVGPYQVVATNSDTGNCLLALPDEVKVHPWFATDKLKHYFARDGVIPEPVNSKEPEEEFEVDKVLEYDEEKDMYLVSWKGYPPEDNQWEPSANLQNAPGKIDEYWAGHGMNNKVYTAYRKAGKLASKAKREAAHSRLMEVTAEHYFYPSDDTDGGDL
jgi:hypothetical protein